MLAITAFALAALFVGAAVYVLFAEHPARRLLAPREQLTQWKFSYARGTIMQAPLAALSGLAGIAVWLRWSDPLFLAGGLAMLGAIAYTFTFMWRLNNRLNATGPDTASAETAAMLERWARLHGVRMAIGLAGMGCYAAGLYRG